MRFDTAQHMKMGQQMKLAPRMIQSMEILQLALPALEERIEQELESNVALEAAEPSLEDTVSPPEPAVDSSAASDRELNVDAEGGADDFERLTQYESDYSEAVDNEYSASRITRDEIATPSSRLNGERDAKMDAMANTAARSASLTEQLLDQWRFTDVAEHLRTPGEVLISHIDDDGYLRTPFETIIAQAPPGETPLTEDLLEEALLAVQLFLEPVGIGARDARECLLLQVDAILDGNDADADLKNARVLIEHHLDHLIHNRLPKAADASGLSLDEVKRAMEPMRRLSLHPGRSLAPTHAEVITPDAIVEYDDDSDTYFAYLTDSRLPNLQVNREYALMAKDRAVPKSDRDFIKTSVGNAQWLIDAVNQRRQTLQRVINVVIDVQREVFDVGIEALKPLPMTQVADQLGMHVATVSRAVAGKYLQTPRGIMPLRKFFTGGTQTQSGEDVSWDAIKAALQDVVDAEDKKKPLSDEALVKALGERGIEIARRTVAKYRSQLDIPPARMRKKF